MRFTKPENGNELRKGFNQKSGFTLVEVMLAAALLMILCVGILSVFSYVTNINRGENLRAQALSVLQLEVEYYRSLKFVPISSAIELNGGNYPNIRVRESANGKKFNISVVIDNKPYVAGIQTSANEPESNCKFKEITIKATPQQAETGWLSDLSTSITIQRVRSN